jgi:lycopene cyclase domain-containing protein
VTYLAFLALFVLPPLALVAYRHRAVLRRGGVRPMLFLLLVVYAAASVWDNAAVALGLWDFAPDRLVGLRLGLLPLEEYLFFGLQTLLTGLWVQGRLP